MADPAFEQRLCRLYGEAPPWADQARFTAAVQRRLERSWGMRRLLIGAAGTAGGVIVAVQVLGANLIQQAGTASGAADNHLRRASVDVLARGEAVLGAHLPSIGGEALWMIAGLAGLGVALVAARLMEAL